MPTVNCPSCGRALEVDDAHRDWTVRCPHCATEFVPAAVAPAPFERAGRRDADEYDDGYDRPRRRRDPERDEWVLAEATHLVYGPGTWLEVCGWLGGLLLAGGAVLRIALAAVLANNPNPPPGQVEELVVGGVMSGLLALPYTVVLVIAGRKTRGLSGFGWAMTGAVVAIASFVLICFVCVCAFVPVGIGVWGVVVLSNPLVRRGFELRARAARRRDWED